MGDCPNNYKTQNEYEKAFFESDEDSDVCTSCDNLVYNNGISECALFSNKQVRKDTK